MKCLEVNVILSTPDILLGFLYIVFNLKLQSWDVSGSGDKIFHDIFSFCLICYSFSPFVGIEEKVCKRDLSLLSV